MFADKLKRNITYQYLLQAAINLYPFITLPYLTRVLGPDDFAVRAFSLSFMLIATALVSYGFNEYGTKVVAEDPEDKRSIGRLMTSITVLRLVLALVGCVSILIASVFIPIMGNNLIYMLIAYVGVCFTSMLPDFIFQGLQDMSILTRRFVGTKTIAIIFIFVLVRGPQDLILVAVLESAASLVAFAWSWADVLGKRHLRFFIRSLRVADLRTCLAEATAFFVSTLSTTLLNAFTTVMIGLLITDDAQISFWSLSISVVGGFQSLYTPFSNSLYPYVVSTHSLREVKRMLAMGTPLVIAATIAVWCFARPIMILLGGAAYADGASVLQCVSPVVLLSFPVIELGYPVLAATGNIKKLTMGSVVSTATNIAGLIALAVCGGFTVNAVAVVRSVAEFVLTAWCIGSVWRLRKDNVIL